MYVEITASVNMFIFSISICCLAHWGRAMCRIICSHILKWTKRKIYFNLYNEKEIWIKSLYDAL
jgi:hypothetical protein